MSVFATQNYFSYNNIQEKDGYVASSEPSNLPDEYFDIEKTFTLDDVREEKIMPKSRTANQIENKEYIFDKMLNTIDYFTSVQGEYLRYDSQQTNPDTFQYAVDLTQNQSSLITKTSNSLDKTYTTYFKDGKIYDFVATTNLLTKGNNDLELQFESNYDIDDSSNKIRNVKSTSRIQSLPNGEKIYYYRSDNILLGEATGSLFPQEMAMGFLADFSQWSITGEETYAEQNCLIIEGSINGDYAVKIGVNTFKMYVDFATGVLLKYDGKNSDGDIVSAIDTNFIQYNLAIEPSIFTQFDTAALNK